MLTHFGPLSVRHDFKLTQGASSHLQQAGWDLFFGSSHSELTMELKAFKGCFTGPSTSAHVWLERSHGEAASPARTPDIRYSDVARYVGLPLGVGVRCQKHEGMAVPLFDCPEAYT